MSYNYCKPRPHNPRYHNNDTYQAIFVEQGLSISPAQIDTLTRNGMSVNTVNNLQFFEGTDNPPSVVPLEQQRGIDAADVWQADKTAKRKLYALVKSAQTSDVSN